MNAHDYNNEKRLDEYIDALNAGRPAPLPADDADLADLFATARDIHRLRSTEPDRSDVPSRLAAALERDLRANPSDTTRRNESNDMSRFRHASSNGSLRPTGETMTAYPLPKRPERARQWAQFAVAAIAFVLIGVVLAQIIGSGTGDEHPSAVGTDRDATATTQIVVPEATITPSTVAVTPTATLPVIPPTPDATGATRVETFDDARALVPFELLEPVTVPSTLALSGLDIFSDDLVQAYYRHSSEGALVYFVQTSRECSDTSTNTVTYDDVEIAGEVVRRGLGTDAGGRPLASFRWQAGDVCLNVFASLQDGIDEQLLVAFAVSILAPEVATPQMEATPTVPAVPAPATPTPSLTSFATLSLTADYVTCDSVVVANGSNFDPGTTVVIYGGALFGDNLGPVTDDIQVTGTGGFKVTLDIGRIFTQCRGADVPQDGAQFLLSAETGSTLTKGGFDGPSAMAVMTYSSSAPAALKDRPLLPSCGIEIIRTETEMAPQGEPNVQGRECFAAAAAAGSAAEFSSYVQMQDFWVQTTIYRTTGNGEVVGIIGSAARGIWERYDCTGISLQDQEPYEFQFETCGRPEAIE